MTFSNFLILNSSTGSLTGFDQLGLNLTTLQDGLELARDHDILASLSPDTCSQDLPALHPKRNAQLLESPLGVRLSLGGSCSGLACNARTDRNQHDSNPNVDLLFWIINNDIALYYWIFEPYIALYFWIYTYIIVHIRLGSS